MLSMPTQPAFAQADPAARQVAAAKRDGPQEGPIPRLPNGMVNLMGLVTRFIAFLSGLFDTYVIDGLVNFWRGFTRTLSSVLRLIQTGNARDYLTWTLVGVLILAMALA